ncbi:hypothetical protein BDV18DRAFT_12954 [Aspergillus unguis]
MDTRSAPVTLRKACEACARGKRRCDRQWPRCNRCQALDRSCHYVNVPLTVARRSPSTGPTGSTSPRMVYGTGGSVGIERPLHLEIPKGYEQSIVSFLVSEISSLPLSFVENFKTHFTHPELWSNASLPPLPIRGIHPVCQYYAHSSTNPMLPQLLKQRIKYYATRISSPSTFEEMLASAQALLLAQCMLLATEDPATPYAESTSTMLLALGRKLYEQAPIQLPNTLSPRRAWVLGESVRRTIIVSFMLRSVYSLTKRKYSVRTPFVDSLPFDCRTHLWDSVCPSELGPEDPGSMVSLHQYSGMLETGQVHGISAFGGMILAACRGKNVGEVPYPAVAG